MSTDTKIKTLIFNKLTQEQYDAADRVPTEFYLTPDTSIDSSEKGAANGVASLDKNAKVPVAQIPDLSSTYATINSLATVATSGSYNDLADKPTIPTKLSDLTNDSGFVKNGDVLLDVSAHSTENPRYIWQEKLDDCLYRAETRYTVNLTNFASSNHTARMFDGNPETYCSILAGNTGVVSISGNTNFGLGYPYGYIYCTFFSWCGPRDISDVTCRVYQNWPGHNIGWVTLTGQEVASRTQDGGIKSINTLRFKTQNYGINQIEITLNNTNGTSTFEGTDMRLCAINFFSTRTSIHSLPVLTKFGGDTIYGNLTIPTTNGSFIGNLSGTASRATADASGNTISTTYAKKSTLAKVATSGSYTDLTGIPGAATANTLGLVKPDGTTITVTENGTISAAGGSTTAGRTLGEVYFSQSPLTTDNPGALPGWTGEYYENGKTLFPDLYNFVKAHSELQVTKAQYDNAIATYGECPKYVVDENTAQTSLRLPKYSRSHGAVIKAKKPTGTDHSWYRLYSDGWLEQGGRTEKVADYGTATITLPLQFLDTHYIVTYGNWRTGTTDDGTWNNSAILNDSTKSTTSFQIYSRGNTDGGKIYTWYACGQGADGSQENTLYPWISSYTSAIPASVAQAAEFTGALAGKANTDLSNVSANIDYVVDYKNPTESDPNWYTKWKSGKLEQGGVVPATTGNITFLKPFANTNYTVVGNISLTYRRAEQGDGSGSILFFPEATSFCYVTWAARNFGDIGGQKISWRAEGQGAQ